jgi:hypothetical protein
MKYSFRLTCLLPLLLMGLSCGDPPDVYSITIPNAKVEADWTIVGLDFNINAGSVQAVQNIPLGWTFTVVDGATWKTKIRGVCTTQSASLSPDELKKIVFQVRRNEGENFKFDLSGTFTTTRAFDNGKLIPLTMKDFSLTGSQ